MHLPHASMTRRLFSLKTAAMPWAFAGMLSLLCPAFGQQTNQPSAASAPVTAQTASPAPRATRPTRLLEEAELRDHLTAALNRSCGGTKADWELHFTRQWTPVSVPDESLSLNIIEPALDRIGSSSILRFELRAGRELLGSWQLPVQARLWRTVPVAHSALRRGQRLSESDFSTDRRDMLTLRDPLLELPSYLDRYEVAENVPAGAPLCARAIRLRPIISRGQLADAIVQDGAMVISLKVEVLDEGVPGQMVRVRNLQSRRELRGKVQDEKTIAITL